MPLDLLIRGGLIGTRHGLVLSDLGISGETIVELAPRLETAALETVDATNMAIFPGVIDAHVHFNEPGRTEWEGVSTGSRALAAGGGTCFFDMPLNASPPTLDAASFDAKLLACQRSSHTDFAFWGGLTPSNLGQMGELAERGVIGFKAFMSESGIPDFLHCDDATLFHGMAIAAELGLPVAVHAENHALTSALALQAQRRSQTSPSDFVASRPLIAELEAIQRAILWAAETGCRLHIVHISHPQGVAWARQLATLRGCDLTCETCPHYLLLNSETLATAGALAKCAPPLRDEFARQGLVQALRDGIIDTVGSDHSPCTPDMKVAGSFFDAWGGISGVQLTLRALLTLEVDPGRLVCVTAENVANRFGLTSKGRIATGFDADLTLIDLASKSILKREDLLDRHRLSPYVGRPFRGTVEMTMVRGNRIYQDGKIVAEPKGKLVRPTR